MYRLVLSALDVERKRPRDVAAPLLRHFARGEEVDPEQINRKTPLIFGYPNPHSMHAEAGKTPLPEKGSITRADIQLALAKNLREVANVPFASAFRAAGKAKLGILDVYKQTVEAREEELLEDLRSKNPGKRFVVDELHRIGHAPKPNPLAAKLIAAGAPGYSLLIRRDGMAFDWSALMAVYAAICKNGGQVLEGEPLVADCTSSAEAIDRYLREVLVPEAWEYIYDLVRDGLEVPGHDVLALFTQEGQYIGRVIRSQGLGVIPKLYYTDEELIDGKVNILVGHAQQALRVVNLGPGIVNSFSEVHCSEPVFMASHYRSKQLSIADHATTHAIDPRELKLLPGVRCGSASSGGVARPLYAIDGEVVRVRPEDKSIYDQHYLMGENWHLESDFPLLFPVTQIGAPENEPSPGTRSERLTPKLMLPPEVVEFQGRVKRLSRRETADALRVLEDPAELDALLQLLHAYVTPALIEETAEALFASAYYEPDEYFEIDVEEEQPRLRDEWSGDLELLPKLIEAMQVRFPFLSRYGQNTHWAILRAWTDDLAGISVDDLGVADVLVQLVLLASGSVSGKVPEWFEKTPSLTAVGRWAEGRIALSDVISVAAEFESYEKKLFSQTLHIKAIRSALADEDDRRERSRELGVAYAGDRIVVRPSDRVGAL